MSEQQLTGVTAVASSGDAVGGGGLPEREGKQGPKRVGLASAVGLRQVVLVASLVLLVVFFYVQEPDTFLSVANMRNLVNGMPVMAALALAVTVVLILGEFDLSVPNVAALTSITIAILATQTGAPVFLVLVVGLAVGVALGLANGVAVAYGKASAFVVTLAVGSVALGLELFVQGKISLGSSSILAASLPSELTNLSSTHVLGFELGVWVFLIVTAILWLTVARTPWGRHARSIGGNEVAARLAGVAVQRTKVVAFMVTGLVASVGGLLFTSQNGYFAQSLTSFLLPAYAAAFFGGAAIGRRGFSIGATLFGVLYLSVLANGLIIMNQATWVVSAVQGVVLLVAVLIARSGGSSS